MKNFNILTLISFFFTLVGGQPNIIKTDHETQTPTTMTILYTSDSDGIGNADFDPTGDRLAVIDGNQVVIIDLKTEAASMILEGDSQVFTVDWNPTGEYLAGYAGSGPYVWSLETGQRVDIPFERENRRPYAEYGVIAWSPDGTMLAGAGRGSKIYVWGAETGAQIAVFKLESPEYIVPLDLSWSPDGKFLASTTREAHEFQVWELAASESPVTIHCDRCIVFSLAWSPDGTMLAGSGQIITEGTEDTVWIWKWNADDPDDYQLISTLSHHYFTGDIAWDTDSQKLLTTLGEIWILDGELVETFSKEHAVDYRVGSLIHASWDSAHQMAVITTKDEVQLFTNLTP